MLRQQIEALEQEKDRAEQRLGELNTEMIYRDFTIQTIENYKIPVVNIVMRSKQMNEIPIRYVTFPCIFPSFSLLFFECLAW